MGNDEVSKNPQALAEAQAFRDRRPSDPPPRVAETMMYDGKAIARAEYDAQAGKGVLSFEEIWDSLKHDGTGKVVGMLTEEEFRKYFRMTVMFHNASAIAKAAEAEMTKAQVVVKGLFTELRMRVGMPDDKHFHLDLAAGAIHECSGDDERTSKDLARMLLAKIAGG